MYPVRYRHDHVIVVSRCAHSSHTPLDPYLSARAFDGRRGALSRFSSDGRPRAKGAMRWPRTKNCSAPEHLTPSECRRATGTTLDAEYLSVGLQVRCSVRCSSRCCCCPYFAAHRSRSSGAGPRGSAAARGCSWCGYELAKPQLAGAAARTAATDSLSRVVRANLCANAPAPVGQQPTRCGTLLTCVGA